MRGLGVLVAIGLCGCGSSSSTSTTKDAATNRPVDAAGTSVDSPATTKTDTSATKTDAAGLPGDGATALPSEAGATDGVGAAPSDAVHATRDGSTVVDAAAPLDAPVVPRTDGGTVTTSTTTVDNATTLCSTYALGSKDWQADQPLAIVLPDCPRLSGTVTLAGPLPTGAVWSNGQVGVIKVIRDGANKVADTVYYAAAITPVDSTHFKYQVGVPAGTYEMEFMFTVKSSDLIPSTAMRIAQENIVVEQGMVHDVTLPAIEVATVTATITGADTTALPSVSTTFMRYLQVTALNPGNTLMTTGMSMSVSAQTPVAMWIPKDGLTPTVMVQDTPGALPPYPSGFTSQFKLQFIKPSADFSLALPAAAKITGSIKDPTSALSPMIGVGAPGTSAVSYYHCNSMDYGTFPDPIFFYPEGSTSSYFSATTSHGLYVRKGLECITYANYAVATGAGLPTIAGENTYAFMQDPTPKSPEAITVSTDLVRDVNVPSLGTMLNIAGTVKDSRGAAVTNAQVDFNSSTLAEATLANKTFVGTLTARGDGTFTAHAPKGTYTVRVKLVNETATTPTPDAGAPKDAAFNLPDGFSMPDVAFTMPDLGSTADCATLSACCESLTGTDKLMCTTIAGLGVGLTCTSTLATFKTQSKCL